MAAHEEATLHEVTRLLCAWRSGDETAKEHLFQLLYDDLRMLAHRQRRNWWGNETLNTTALVHELYFKLGGQAGLNAQDRGHLNLIAAKALRYIMADYAIAAKRQKRGGGAVKESLDELGEPAGLLATQAEEILDIHEALDQLARYNDRLAQVVEMHFFAGLSYDEIAEALSVAKKTVARDWQKAKAMLQQILTENQPESHAD